MEGKVALGIQKGVPVIWREDTAFRDLPADGALAWCKYLGLRRGEFKRDRLQVLVTWFEQRPDLGPIYRVAPETACPCLDCLYTGILPTGEAVTLETANTIFNRKLGGGHAVIRPQHNI